MAKEDSLTSGISVPVKIPISTQVHNDGKFVVRNTLSEGVIITFPFRNVTITIYFWQK